MLTSYFITPVLDFVFSVTQTTI